MSNRDNIEITLITENDRERMEQVAQMETDVFPDPWSYHEVRSTVRQKHTFCAAEQGAHPVQHRGLPDQPQVGRAEAGV